MEQSNVEQGNVDESNVDESNVDESQKTKVLRDISDTERKSVVIGGIPFYLSSGDNSGAFLSRTWLPYLGDTGMMGYDKLILENFKEGFPPELYQFMINGPYNELLDSDLHPIMHRFGNFETMCISLVLGGWFWNTVVGKKLKEFIIEHFPQEINEIRDYFRSHPLSKEVEDVDVNANQGRIKRAKYINNWLFNQGAQVLGQKGDNFAYSNLKFIKKEIKKSKPEEQQLNVKKEVQPKVQRHRKEPPEVKEPQLLDTSKYSKEHHYGDFETVNKRDSQEDSLTFKSFENNELTSKDNSQLLQPEEIARRLWTTYQILDQEVLEQSMTSGTTASTTIYDGTGNLITATLADSASFAVVYDKQGKALVVVRLNEVTHKPTEPGEKDRITQAGGWIYQGRVNGNLAVSRAIGDHKVDPTLDPIYDLKNSGVCSESSIDITNLDKIVNDLKIKPEDVGLIQVITTCDGFTDGAGRDKQTKKDHEEFLFEALKEIEKEIGLPGTLSEDKLSQLLVNKAIDKRSTDNISVAIKTITKDSPPFLLGVYDGHSGPEVSKYVAEHIVGEFTKQCSLTSEQYTQQKLSVNNNVSNYKRDNSNLDQYDKPKTNIVLDKLPESSKRDTFFKQDEKKILLEPQKNDEQQEDERKRDEEQRKAKEVEQRKRDEQQRRALNSQRLIREAFENINAALNDLQLKINQIDSNHERAHIIASKLLQDLREARDRYETNLKKPKANIEYVGKIFKSECAQLIENTKTLLKKEGLNWGEYLGNLFKIIANAIISVTNKLIGSKIGLFIPTKAAGLSAVEEVEENLDIKQNKP